MILMGKKSNTYYKGRDTRVTGSGKKCNQSCKKSNTSNNKMLILASLMQDQAQNLHKSFSFKQSLLFHSKKVYLVYIICVFFIKLIYMFSVYKS